LHFLCRHVRLCWHTLASVFQHDHHQLSNEICSLWILSLRKSVPGSILTILETDKPEPSTLVSSILSRFSSTIPTYMYDHIERQSHTHLQHFTLVPLLFCTLQFHRSLCSSYYTYCVRQYRNQPSISTNPPQSCPITPETPYQSFCYQRIF